MTRRLTSAVRSCGGNDGLKAGFQLDQIHLIRIRENGDRPIGQDHVRHADPLATPRPGGPSTGRGLVGEMSQEGTVT